MQFGTEWDSPIIQDSDEAGSPTCVRGGWPNRIGKSGRPTWLAGLRNAKIVVMGHALLLTQCLQKDFVEPIGRHATLPNLLHIGHSEARRLLGEDPKQGPLARFMRWAYAQPDGQLDIIHIRDWHQADDPAQRAHLDHFGTHCIADSDGAGLVFDEPSHNKQSVNFVDALTLNDFEGTRLESLLDPLCDRPISVGLIGVWTEAKITFLAYELATRYEKFQLATCSALTASSSRSQHFIALEQLQKLLGLKVYSSLGRFVEFLGGDTENLQTNWPAHSQQLKIEVEGVSLRDDDLKLCQYLFRNCRSVQLKSLDGGFSGNAVLGSKSLDAYGHVQAPHVLKIGPQELIGQERSAFERIESVLGNSAPQLTEFADLGERGALKYRYASMGGGFSTTFQKQYTNGMSQAAVSSTLNTVFVEQLGRLYSAAEHEPCDLLDYYQFYDLSRTQRVYASIEALYGAPATDQELSFPGNRRVTHVGRFYSEVLPELTPERRDTSYFAFVHGDLNAANIILDGQQNVWLIDFFHTHRGHVLKDLLKFENDLLYILTPLENESEWAEALVLTDRLMAIDRLNQELEPAAQVGLRLPQLTRAWDAVRILRGFYAKLIKADTHPLQTWIGMLGTPCTP